MVATDKNFVSLKPICNRWGEEDRHRRACNQASFVRKFGVGLAVVLFSLLTQRNSVSQVTFISKHFDSITVPYNAPAGLTLTFDVSSSGTITQYGWGFSSTGWRDLHITYTSPVGIVLEQIAGQPWIDVSSIYGTEAAGLWKLNLTETIPGPSEVMGTSVDMTILRHADPNLPVTGTSAPSLNGVDQLIIPWMRQNEFEASTLAVTKNRRLVYTKGYGWQDYDRTVPIEPGAVMRLASNTKPITQRAIRKLVEEGHLSLEDKVYDVLAIQPWNQSQPHDSRVRAITIRHLLDHSSGLMSNAPGTGTLGNTLLLNRAATLDETIAYAWIQDLLFDPGTQNQYSNLGYQILGSVVEKVSGMSYDTFVRTQIAEPLGIVSMGVGSSTEEGKAPHEIWYAGHGYYHKEVDYDQTQEREPEPYASDMATRPGAGALICSAEDYCRYLRAYFHHGDPKPTNLQGITWSYTFYGSLPGTWTITRDLINPDGTSISYVFLVNERIDGTSSALNDLASELDSYFTSVATWPSNDLFEGAFTFTKTPHSAHYGEGIPLSMTVAFTGAVGIPQIQWMKNSVDIPGETGHTLSIDTLSVADTGAYCVRVTDDVGEHVSQSAIITVTEGHLPLATPLTLFLTFAGIAFTGALTLPKKRKGHPSVDKG